MAHQIPNRDSASPIGEQTVQRLPCCTLSALRFAVVFRGFPATDGFSLLLSGAALSGGAR